MKKIVSTLVIATLVLGVSLNTAYAIKPFKDEFDAKYVKDSNNAEFVEAVKKANCNLCHGKNAEGKDDKKVRNAYGMALDKLLDKKEDAKNKEKIQAALDTVAAEKSNPDNPNAPTFGELIKQGKLPGGN
ncbi:MAG TPA: hypothetical protein VGG64_14375 [Pirellulales bacterium]|jgi:cytochrome c553